MGVESAQDRHRPGALKQQNKAHKHGRHRSKGAIDNAMKGTGMPGRLFWFVMIMLYCKVVCVCVIGSI
ncbi:hypothetical protein Cfor_07501 [Coptotermes formosanus]|jgi:hypothetical protein|uniref:Uncharacterized protein n=1 Tax=Coptotermes formosanus TaxID=36987 RepID=A0A6L2PMY2_COPFO|nr:hypothetical protein Cfor_07501 [Coptotermes formosanus]